MAVHQAVMWMSQTWVRVSKQRFWRAYARVYGSLRFIPSTECAPVIREPVSNFADTGPRDSDPPHFKTSCYPAIPPELHRGGKCSSRARWPTIAPFAPPLWKTTQLPGAKEWLCQSDVALEWYLWAGTTFLLWFAPCRGAWSLSSLVFDPLTKDGPQECISRLRLTGLCDNLQRRAMSRRCLPLRQPLCRVSKAPPFICGAHECLTGYCALTLSEERTEKFSAETRRRVLSYTRSKSLKSLRSPVHPYCFGRCLRHNMQFSVHPRQIQLTDGIWDTRRAFRWLMIGTDDSLQQ